VLFDRRAVALAVAGVLWANASVGATAAGRSGPALPPGLASAERARLEEVAAGAAVSTRVDGAAFPARREVFEYLLDHPELASHLARALKFGRYRIWQTPEGFALDDGWGATGRFSVVHAAPGTRVMYARGRYDKAVLPSVHGDAVAMIEYDVTRAAGGQSLVRAVVSGWVRLDSRVMTLAIRVARTLAQRKADLEAHRLIKVFAKVSRAIEERPREVYEALRRRPDVPAQDLAKFAELIDRR
jgi:hypothetical protein